MSIDMAQFHQVFFEESFEGLEVMETGLMELEPGDADIEVINSIFRAAHSIKGGSGTFGFKAIADFTHVMETLLDEMRDGVRDVTTENADILLRAVDCLREMLQAAQAGDDADADRVSVHQKELEDELANKGGAAAPPPANTSSASAAPTAVANSAAGWRISFMPHRQILQTANDPMAILRELRELGELELETELSAVPDFDQLEPEDCYLGWRLTLHGDAELDQVKEVFSWVEDLCDLEITPLNGTMATAAPEQVAQVATTAAPKPDPSGNPATAKPAAPKAAPAKAGADKAERKNAGQSSGASSIRVETAKIDSLINMVGELVITQSMLGLLGEMIEEKQAVTGQDIDKMLDGLMQLERNTRELQESVMQVRMMPISFTFSRFPRLVRDLSNKMGKKIELKLSGENTEVDKTVIEKIGDPMVHLVRNSLDHGIEAPGDRIEAGKAETGTIELNAYHQGGNIVIEIKDDGRGMDRDKLFSKAVEKGLIEEDAILSDKQVFELIFMPGFSTAEVVSDVSGRGVGMDVVRRNIQELGGSVEIDSTKGLGTKMTIRLPLTLAILDGQTVRVAEENYIIPINSIIESIQVKSDMINRVGGQGETFRLRDEYIPIIKLHDVFGVECDTNCDLSEGLLVVVESEGEHVGLFVDDLLGQQQVVIKSLEANYKKIEGFSGATILGDGSVALILDMPGILRLNKTLKHHSRAA
jgi:two-component system chemotaxis sensor kinase CheA